MRTRNEILKAIEYRTIETPTLGKILDPNYFPEDKMDVLLEVMLDIRDSLTKEIN